MIVNAIIINDEKAKKHFAFIRQYPGVCAQGDTISEVKAKIEKHFNAFKERINSEKIQFSQPEDF